ncbi:MAG: IS91 family transposase [Planctomycetota bacterium]
MSCSAALHRRSECPPLELADIFRQYVDHMPPLSRQQARAVRAILHCRTAALGGHIQECHRCGYQQISYNSCRDRHCPKCQGLDQARWLQAQQQHLLPIEYHHAVFTVPDLLHPFFRAEPKKTYALLFAAVAETLQEVALRPKNLGAKIGFTCVLHTWTQTLLLHPHLHCIVTGGGLHPDGTRWIGAQPRFLFSVQILTLVFRGKLLQKLERALDTGSLPRTPSDSKARLRAAARKKWSVYSKPPFAGPQQVLHYLGRYTHRVALSNSRLLEMNDGQVTFRYRDRADGNQSKIMTLDAGEFLRRFLLHILPQGFMRIRHYGLLANRSRRTLLQSCRQLLEVPSETPPPAPPETWQDLLQRLTGKDPTLCPRCGQGHLVLQSSFSPQPAGVWPTFTAKARAP